MAVEGVRVWNLTASEKGRIGGTRKTHKHYHQTPLEEPSTSERPGENDETAILEDAGNIADSEAPLQAVGTQRPKRKRRVRTVKNNDSVSVIYLYHSLT